MYVVYLVSISSFDVKKNVIFINKQVLRHKNPKDLAFKRTLKQGL